MEPERERGSVTDGVWRVERTSGLLPPMAGVWKRIEGDRGETRLGPLLRLPFRVERRDGLVFLVYRPPFSALVDEISPGGRDLWHGRATLGGRPLGKRVLPTRYPRSPNFMQPPSPHSSGE